jgi:hypothetical protein
MFVKRHWAYALDDFKLKFGQIANSVMLFRVRVIISCKHLAKIQKREFTFMKVVSGNLLSCSVLDQYQCFQVDEGIKNPIFTHPLIDQLEGCSDRPIRSYF